MKATLNDLPVDTIFKVNNGQWYGLVCLEEDNALTVHSGDTAEVFSLLTKPKTVQALTKGFLKDLDITILYDVMAYHNLFQAFQTLWYDSSIPDAGTLPLMEACKLLYPKEEDSLSTLEGKAFLLHQMAQHIFEEKSDQYQEIERYTRPILQHAIDRDNPSYPDY